MERGSAPIPIYQLLEITYRIPRFPHLLLVASCNIIFYCLGLLVVKRKCLLNIIQPVISLFVQDTCQSKVSLYSQIIHYLKDISQAFLSLVQSEAHSKACPKFKLTHPKARGSSPPKILLSPQSLMYIDMHTQFFPDLYLDWAIFVGLSFFLDPQTITSGSTDQAFTTFQTMLFVPHPYRVSLMIISIYRLEANLKIKWRKLGNNLEV